MSFWPPFVKEIEGVAVGPMLIDGVATHVHLAYLVKNHTFLRDSIRLKSFSLPEYDSGEPERDQPPGSAL